MAFDPNLNSGIGASSVNNADCVEYPEWCQNEESFDLTSFMSSSKNLELCNDDLFENLFPSDSPAQEPPKKENPDHLVDQEMEYWYQRSAANDLYSACASACSSTATSPAPQNYYNTPPVTPRADRYRASPHHLQADGLTASMSSSRLASLRSENQQPNQHVVASAQLSHEIQQYPSMQPMVVKQEPNLDYSSSTAPFGVGHQNNPSLTMPATTSLLQKRQEPSSIPSQASNPSPLNKRATTSSISTASKKAKAVEKGSYEYIEKRKRNNVAVRRSRDKAKLKALETQKKVDELTKENGALRERVANLSHELNTLKNLLTSLPQSGLKSVNAYLK